MFLTSPYCISNLGVALVHEKFAPEDEYGGCRAKINFSPCKKTGKVCSLSFYKELLRVSANFIGN